MTKPVRHTHLTRDIKNPGACPACDYYHAIVSAVRDYDIAGDGVTDDTAAVQAAIDGTATKPRIKRIEAILRAAKMHEPDCPAAWSCDKEGCLVYHVSSPCTCWLAD